MLRVVYTIALATLNLSKLVSHELTTSPAQAAEFCETVKLPIDAANLAQRIKTRGIISDGDKDEDHLRKFFARVDIGKVKDPASITDSGGRIVTWHLPDIISAARVV
jgi:hypothetical protein